MYFGQQVLLCSKLRLIGLDACNAQLEPLDGVSHGHSKGSAHNLRKHHKIMTHHKGYDGSYVGQHITCKIKAR